MEAMRFEMEVLHENLMKEKEERQGDREEMMREREELMKEVEEGKKTREAQQEQLNHLNSVVLRLSTLLECSDSHHRIWSGVRAEYAITLVEKGHFGGENSKQPPNHRVAHTDSFSITNRNCDN
ncbi:hypothetical protein CsSME_00046553 [Camellia sinensis var. sinensis]